MSNKPESHEEFMKRCFGDDFWERPVQERFMMVAKRVIRAKPVIKISKSEKLRERVAKAKEKHVSGKG